MLSCSLHTVHCTVCAENIVIPVCAYIVTIFNAVVCLSHTAGFASCQLLQKICSTLSTFLSIAAFVERFQKVTSVNLCSRSSLSSSLRLLWEFFQSFRHKLEFVPGSHVVTRHHYNFWSTSSLGWSLLAGNSIVNATIVMHDIWWIQKQGVFKGRHLRG